MPTNFPTSLDSYTNKVDGVDTVQAAHVNNLQDAVVAIEALLGAGSASGTYTPVLAFGGASVGVGYTTQLGRYLRLGNFVAVAGVIVLSAKGSSVGNATISLPVSVNALFNSYFAAYWAATNIGLISVGIYPTSGTSTALVMGAASAATNPSILTDTSFTNTTQIRFGGVYFA